MGWAEPPAVNLGEFRMKSFLLATASVALMASGALAQDYSAPPSYGSVSLNAGFQPDPYNVNITSGGSIPASNISGECRGWVANAPDYSVNYAAGGYDLTIGATSNSDTTLLINGPNGEWYCDDDGGDGLNPLVRLTNPNSGRYDVWIGSYSQGDFAATTLSVSELGLTQGNAGTPNYAAAPTFGSINLSSGFTPDPYTVNVTSGGDRSAAAISGECRGWIADAPDFSVNYNAGGYDTLTIGAVSSSDTTLVVNDAYGNWFCDDDGGNGLNPMVTLANLASGRYDIWVGSYSEGDYANSILSISEIGRVANAPPPAYVPQQQRPQQQPQYQQPQYQQPQQPQYQQPQYQQQAQSGIDMSLPAAFGTATLRTGFQPDPYRVNITSGGGYRADSVEPSCAGWVAAAPDFELTFTAGSLPLILSAASNSDTTILVNDPNGVWFCDDDGGNVGMNPQVRIDRPASGVYDIWIGSFSQGDSAAASLTISELYSE
ncbi:MAG: hypothetical protein ACI82N_001058 [Maricaulis sp.]|jgi:hypothetical protein